MTCLRERGEGLFIASVKAMTEGLSEGRAAILLGIFERAVGGNRKFRLMKSSRRRQGDRAACFVFRGTKQSLAV